jgi:hypothetical protein
MNKFAEGIIDASLRKAKENPGTTAALTGLAGAGLVAGATVPSVVKGYKEKGLKVQQQNPFMNPIANTLGRLATHGLRADKRFKTILRENPARFKEMLEHIQETHPEKDLAINVGGTPILKTIGRGLSNKDASFMQRATSPLSVPLISALTSLMRSDHYNPATKSLTVYQKSPEILAHEFGHFMDMKNKSKVTNKNDRGNVDNMVRQEIKASNNAAGLMGQAKLKRDKKVLAGALETYLMGASQMDPEFVLRAHKYLPEKSLK